MDPILASQILQAVLAAVAAAPKVEQLVTNARNFIESLFSAGLISKELQDETHAAVDKICAEAEAGVVPVEFTVEPDPE